MIAMFRASSPSDSRATRGIAQWSDIRLHLSRRAKIAELGASSKLNAEWAFLTMLRDEGRHCAEQFLDKHGADLGRRSTFDIDSLLIRAWRGLSAMRACWASSRRSAC